MRATARRKTLALRPKQPEWPPLPTCMRDRALLTAKLSAAAAEPSPEKTSVVVEFVVPNGAYRLAPEWIRSRC